MPAAAVASTSTSSSSSAQPVFKAAVDDVRPLATVLRTLSFSRKATVEIRESGLKLTVEDGRSIQANAYLRNTLFSSFEYEPPLPPTPAAANDNNKNGSESDDDDDEGRAGGARGEWAPVSAFEISLATLLEVVNIFGNAVSLPLPRGHAGDPTGRGDGGEGEASTSRDDGNPWRKRAREQREGGAATAAATAQQHGKGPARGATTMRMQYQGEGHPLVLFLEEDDIVTTCEITTYDPEPSMELAFDESERVQKLIMKSFWLHDALGVIDGSCERLKITFLPRGIGADQGGDLFATPAPRGNRSSAWRASGGGDDEDDDDDDDDDDDTGEQNKKKKQVVFKLEATGALDSLEIDFADDRDVLELYECYSPIGNTYRFSHLQRTFKALEASTKTSIKTSDDGLLSIQFLMPLQSIKRPGVKPPEEPQNGFVEFLCIPLETETTG